MRTFFDEVKLVISLVLASLVAVAYDEKSDMRRRYIWWGADFEAFRSWSDSRFFWVVAAEAKASEAFWAES